MMKDSKPKFNDASLSKAISASANQFKSFQKTLDETTADIRSLEKWLLDCGICITSFVTVSSNPDSEFQIGWDKHLPSGVWRLMAVWIFNDEDAGVDMKPLIETTAAVRVTCKPYLVELVRQISKILPVDVGDAPAASNAPEDLDMIFACDDEVPF